MRLERYGIIILLLLAFSACGRRQQAPIVAPWGETIGEQPSEESSRFDLDQIEHTGELIALTISGPMTYYEYRGRVLGVHAMLCQQLADSLGVRLRVELCRDSAELMSRLLQGDGDLIAYPLTAADSLSPGWVIGDDKPQLSETFHHWYTPWRLRQVQTEEQRLLTTATVKRHVYAPMLNRAGGIISSYDGLFQQHCQPIHWDWRLMAAQCYQESTFDPQALSWAGARGLMQIMPETADHLGLPRSQMNDPAQNIAAAARYLGELERSFMEIRDRRERQDFVLASYNGGAHHIRDAMALARRDGRNSYRWSDVQEYVLKLSDPQYYNDPVVQHGYMRGTETVEYVRSIRQRYQQYRGVRSVPPGGSVPQKSRNPRHREKYSV